MPTMAADARKPPRALAGLTGVVIILLAYAGFNAFLSHGPTMNPAASGVPISFDSLFRNAETVRGTEVSLYGRISQVITDGSAYDFRVAVEPDKYGFSTKDVYVHGYSGPRLLENDVVDIVGRADGIQSYRTILGVERQVPSVAVDSVNRSAMPWPTFSVH